MSVAIILGAGSRVGEVCLMSGQMQANKLTLPKAVAAKLKENGYKVALVSRSGSGKATEDTLPIKGDVTIAAEIQNAFEQAEKVLGAPPSVVVYNSEIQPESESVMLNTGDPQLLLQLRLPSRVTLSPFRKLLSISQSIA